MKYLILCILIGVAMMIPGISSLIGCSSSAIDANIIVVKMLDPEKTQTFSGECSVSLYTTGGPYPHHDKVRIECEDKTIKIEATYDMDDVESIEIFSKKTNKKE